MKFSLKKGLQLPITGEPSQTIGETKKCNKVAVIGGDFIGMKPTMLVKEGDTVKTGQPIFSCKKNEGLIFTSPATGTVQAINRGERRVFQSMVLTVSADAHHAFSTYQAKAPGQYSAEEVRALLIESGEWKCLRQRPFEKVAPVGGKADALFINAMDTNPLAPNPEVVVKANEEAFKLGQEVLAKLPQGDTYLCHADGANIPSASGVKTAQFSGPHPAGNVGTHIHFIYPVNVERPVWHVGYQDVIAIGKLFQTGQLFTERVVSIAGPMTQNPRLVKIRAGACVSEVIQGEAKAGKSVRAISGSVFHGHCAKEAFDFHGAYANQITMIEENTERELLGWHSPGPDRFSVKNIYVSKLMPGKKFDFHSNANGSPRAMVPIGSFEKVTPLDILPTQLLRALCSKDTDHAQELGCLELAEEDVALYTFASPGKTDFGPILRENLTTIEKEG